MRSIQKKSGFKQKNSQVISSLKVHSSLKIPVVYDAKTIKHGTLGEIVFDVKTLSLSTYINKQWSTLVDENKAKKIAQEAAQEVIQNNNDTTFNLKGTWNFENAVVIGAVIVE